MSNTVKLSFTPEELRRKRESAEEFEQWVRTVWIEDRVLDRKNENYVFPAINYAHDGWVAGYEAGYRAAKGVKE